MCAPLAAAVSGPPRSPLEYQAPGENFHDRGRHVEEQRAVMQQLCSKPPVTVVGRHHVIDGAGVAPPPAARGIPLRFGGHGSRMVERIIRRATGWIMLALAPDQQRAERRREPADPGRSGRPRSWRHRPRSATLAWRRRRREIATGGPLPETGWSHACRAEQLRRPAAAPAHAGPRRGSTSRALVQYRSLLAGLP